jgi:hypothetical protein
MPREPVRFLLFSAHYPCVKKAWFEFLGEHPNPVIDRVE